MCCWDKLKKTTKVSNKSKKSNITPVSQYVTVSPSTKVEDAWKLMVEVWHLMLPNLIVSIAGSFQQYDNQWKKVMPDTWVLTNGSAPAPATAGASIIAVTSISSVSNNEVLYSLTNAVSLHNVYCQKCLQRTILQGSKLQTGTVSPRSAKTKSR